MDKKRQEADFINNIDLVFPYVDCSDPEWQKVYNSVSPEPFEPARFRSWDTLKYMFRGIDLCMPWIHKVHFIVSSESQLPSWLNYDCDKLHIVYHDQIIPQMFLPTFNSCTIESFLYNIDGLADYIIYGNDDFFPINNMLPTNFFTEYGVPRIVFKSNLKFSTENKFRCQCRSGMDMIQRKIPFTEQYTPNRIFKPIHCFVPMLKSTLIKVGEMYKPEIYLSISQFRNFTCVNQYIYSYYQYFTNNYDSHNTISYNYCSMKFGIKYPIESIGSRNIQAICINDDNPRINYEDAKKQLGDAFSKKFPLKSIFEI